MRFEVPDEVKPLLMSGALVCLPKPNGDVRPIAPQSGIAKVLERVLLRSVTNIPEALLGQFGVGYPDGRGALLALCLRRMQADPDSVLLQLDVSNAFSSIPRD